MGTFFKWTEIKSLKSMPEILSPLYSPETVITEKIDGRNVRFGVIDGLFRVGGRKEEFDFNKSGDGEGKGFLGWLRQTDIPDNVKRMAQELDKSIIFYGEWFGTGIHGEVRYFNEVQKDFLCFGVRIGEDLQDWGTVTELSTKIGIRTVPVLYRGIPLSMEKLNELYAIESPTAKKNKVTLPGNILEGIVITSNPISKLREDWLIAKHKNPKFSERASEQNDADFKPAVPDSGVTEIATNFVNEFWTIQRLGHVFSYLQEKGEDIKSRTILGQAIRGMFEDVMKEGIGEWNTLSEETKRMVGKLHPAITKNLIAEYLRTA